MTRDALIARGQVWQVHPDSDPDKILFEGKSRGACLKFIRDNYTLRAYRNGKIRVGQVLWENGPKEYNEAREIYKTTSKDRRYVKRLRKLGASNYEIANALGIPEDAPVLNE